MSKIKIVIVFLLFLLTSSLISILVTSRTIENQSSSQIKRATFIVGNKESSIINIMGTSSYLKYTIAIEVNEDLYKKTEEKAFTEKDVLVQEVVSQTLRVQKFADLSVDKQHDLKMKIKTNINKALNQEVVFEVYIIYFVIYW